MLSASEPMGTEHYTNFNIIIIIINLPCIVLDHISKPISCRNIPIMKITLENSLTVKIFTSGNYTHLQCGAVPVASFTHFYSAQLIEVIWRHH